MWTTSVANVVGGKLRPESDAPEKSHTTARLTLSSPKDLCTGMVCAKRVARNANLFDITERKFADAIPPYIHGNIQYVDDQRDHEPYPSWYFFADFNGLGKKFNVIQNYIHWEIHC